MGPRAAIPSPTASAAHRYIDDALSGGGNKAGHKAAVERCREGIARLIASDPGAYWDTSCSCVKGSAYGISPRIRPIPLYDPDKYEDGKQEGRNAEFEMVSFLGVFVVEMQGNSVIARVHPISAETLEDPSLTPSSYAMTIRLVK